MSVADEEGANGSVPKESSMQEALTGNGMQMKKRYLSTWRQASLLLWKRGQLHSSNLDISHRRAAPQVPRTQGNPKCFGSEDSEYCV